MKNSNIVSKVASILMSFIFILTLSTAFVSCCGEECKDGKECEATKCEHEGECTTECAAKKEACKAKCEAKKCEHEGECTEECKAKKEACHAKTTKVVKIQKCDHAEGESCSDACKAHEAKCEHEGDCTEACSTKKLEEEHMGCNHPGEECTEACHAETVEVEVTEEVTEE